MKTFDDLEFKPHWSGRGVVSRLRFANGYGVSVVRHDHSYGGPDGLYELAVLGKDGELTYTTPITSDVLGWLQPEEVSHWMQQVEQL